MKVFQITALSLVATLIVPVDAAISRRDQRRYQELIEYDVDNMEALKEQAHLLASQGDFDGAVHRYNIIGRKVKGTSAEPEWLANLAGYEFSAGRPAVALDLVYEFGKHFAESQQITKVIDLAYRIGIGFTLKTNDKFDTLFQDSKAISAFEFINTHDPYSLQAAEGQLSIAAIKMQQNYWDEALVHLKEVLRKQPGSEIAAKAEVIMGECYLGLNKGANYDPKLLIQSERYLSGYLSNYQNGEDREKAQRLLNLVYLRMGRAQLDIARYYCTAKKWQAAKDLLKITLDDSNLKDCHSEAKALTTYVENRL